MSIDVQSVFGFQIGFEIADKEVCEEASMKWGVSVELGFFRLVFSKYE